jgi:hypothetical protein
MVSDDPIAVALAERLLSGAAVLVEENLSEHTAFGNLLAQALDRWIARLDEFPWLWIHSRGLAGPWDAPYEYRLTMCDEGDPDPPSSIDPPQSQVDDTTDPDQVFGWACGAGGQAIAMDEAWDWIQLAIRELHIESHLLLILAGLQGYPLGEHGRVGWIHDSKQIDAPKSELAGRPELHSGFGYAERLHCPLVIQPGTALPLGIRFAPFLQPHQLGRLVDSWLERDGMTQDFTLGSAGDPGVKAYGGDGLESIHMESLLAASGFPRTQWPTQYRSAMAVCGSEVALMLPSWNARWDSWQDDSLPGELYVSPNDRWQQNEVSSRAPEILDQMRLLRDAWLGFDDPADTGLTRLLLEWDESLWRPVR